MASERQRSVFARALKRARADAGLSQRDLASALDVTAAAVSLWEKGETAPRRELLAAIEDQLHVEAGSLSRLLGFLPDHVLEQADSDVYAAINNDQRLGRRERELLLQMYDTLVEQRQREQGQRSDD